MISSDFYKTVKVELFPADIHPWFTDNTPCSSQHNWLIARKAVFIIAWVEEGRGGGGGGEEGGVQSRGVWKDTGLSDWNSSEQPYPELLGKVTRAEEMTKTEAGKEGGNVEK